MRVSESRKRLDQLYRRVVRNGLVGTLRRHGFRKEAGDYLHFVGQEVVCAVRPVRPPLWAKPGEVRFTTSCAVFVTAIEQLFPEGKGPTYHADSTISQIRPQVAEISGEDKGSSWCIREDASEDALSALERAISRVFEVHVLPWFGQFQTAKAVADYLASPEVGPGRIRLGYREIPQDARDLRNAAIAYFGAGEYKRAREMLDLAARTIDPATHLTVDLRERMERLIAQRQKKRFKS